MSAGDTDDQLIDGDVLEDLVGQGGPLSSEEEGDDEGGSEVSQERDFDMQPIDDSVHSFEGHTDAVLAVAWSPVQPDLVASGGQDDKAYLWKVGQDAFESTEGSLGTVELSGHTDTVASLAFSSNGSLLASGGMDGVVKIWDTSSGQLVQDLEGPGDAVNWVRWHPKGNVVLAGSDDMTVWMWLAQTGVCMQVFSGHSGSVSDGCFTPDGKAVVTAGGEGDCSLRVWSPKTGECSANINGHHFHGDAALNCLAVHADSSLVLTGAEDGSVRICNINLATQNKVVAALHWHEESVEAVGWSKHLPLAASGGVDGCLRVWDYNQTAAERAKCQHPDVITRIAWHPTQPLVFTACLDGVARCWDLRTGGLANEFKGHRAGIQDIAISPDGGMVLTGADDQTAKVFSLVAT
ncbi:WD40-repeat-containing domain protein [Haematococcus lacustris]|nr:hypothetical protein QJQ45_018261 [Haematococcus lacustris]KAJ9533744.1 hypothetical protein QJQ45_026795 [Haematococcus lacustris]